MLVNDAWAPFVLFVCCLAPVGRGEQPEALSTEEWAQLRSAYEAGHHAVHRVEGGFQAENPGQRWTTFFDGRGFRTEPDSGTWSWGLELECYGFAGSERDISGAARVHTEGGRVVYDWGGALEEWYVNDSRGLEHGYTIHRRPRRGCADEAGPLTFTLAVRGALCPEVAPDGRDVSFRHESGVTVLTYAGLSVFDADDEAIPASFVRVGKRLRLRIDERGARYPLTIDPLAQQAYIKASNTGTSDFFGHSVAVSGDLAVIGAPFEFSNATGVDGDQSDNSAYQAGAAYVFVRHGASWSQQAYLKASNTDAGDQFGFTVTVSGDTVVVGAPLEASSATGVNGDQSDNSAVNAGAVYVFTRSGMSWSQEAYLKASNTEMYDRFGFSVAICGDTIVVGAIDESSSATGVNGDQSDNGTTASGAAYVFQRSGTTWSQEAYLKASNPDPGDFFGYSLAISGDTVVVAANEEDSSATGVNGIQIDNAAPNAGATYAFVGPGLLGTVVNPANGHTYHLLEHSSWLEAEIAGQTLGGHLVASNDQAENDWLVGTFGEFPPGSFNDLLIGYHDSGSEGTWVWTNGDTSGYWDWAPGQPNGGSSQNFALIRYLTGLGRWHDYDGVDTPERHGVVEVVTEPGLGYCFGDAGSGTACPCSNDNDGSVPGSGCANGAFSSGAKLTGTGTASVSGDTLQLASSGLDPSNAGLYFQANNAINGGDGIHFGDGLRCAGGGLIRLQVRFSDGAGTSSTTIGIAAKGAVSAGDVRRYQCWYRDTSGGQPCGVGVNDFNLSNGYEITWLP